LQKRNGYHTFQPLNNQYIIKNRDEGATERDFALKKKVNDFFQDTNKLSHHFNDSLSLT